jgi:hypothetical protein
MNKNELGSTNFCEHCQSQKIKKQEIKGNFENVFAPYQWVFSMSPSLIRKLLLLKKQ